MINSRSGLVNYATIATDPDTPCSMQQCHKDKGGVARGQHRAGSAAKEASMLQCKASHCQEHAWYPETGQPHGVDAALHTHMHGVDAARHLNLHRCISIYTDRRYDMRIQ